MDPLQLLAELFVQEPAPKVVPGCSFSGAGSSKHPQPKGPLRNIKGGRFRLQTAEIAGVNKLTESLTVITDDDLVVSGQITAFDKGAKPINITLVSLGGAVKILAGASVGSGLRFTGADATLRVGGTALGFGGPGGTAGFIRIEGVSIEIGAAAPGGAAGAAFVLGIKGGPGGAPVATGRSVRRAGGGALAIGGFGGLGGDVRFCAVETIVIRAGSKIESGAGGPGGNAKAEAENGQAGLAVGGVGGPAGDIVFEGFKNCQVTIEAGATVTAEGVIAPAPMKGGKASAKGGDGKLRGFLRGGPCVALGGPGGAGGTVTFIRCNVRNNGKVRSGTGGPGGDALGEGGTAENGANGGSGSAVGAVGGPQGAAPAGIPGGPPGVSSGDPGKGGDANATGGQGGPKPPGGGAPGSSGEADAVGGPNGNGALGGSDHAAAQDPQPGAAVGGGPTSATAQGAP